ncbi:macro domain-containing protein [Aliidiomarina sp. Khilg15.8]
MKYECVQGDITQQNDIEAVVNAANAQLQTGGGVAGAIHNAAGPELEQATQPLAPIRPGDAVITEAFNLPNRYVIHCLGPVYGIDKPADTLLASCYRNTLDLTEKHAIKSVAFPAISTGAFGFPFEAATDIALSTIREWEGRLTYLKTIRFVLFSESDFKRYERMLAS